MNILFVCVGNTCRSPLAEALLKSKLRKRRVKDVSVKSCGVRAQNGLPASNLSIAVAEENKLALKRFKSTQFNEELKNWADVIVCMTSELVPIINDVKAVCFTELYRIPAISDPYGKDIEAYRKTFYDLNFACELLVQDILKNNKN